MAQKNVILISIDDMRTPDDWGHFTPLVSTPNIDRLMGAGTTFERAITQVPLCNPSRTSVMTGLQPSETGVLNNETRWFERVDPADTLPAVLKAAGVYVAMYGKHFHGHPIPPEYNSTMFDEFRPPAAENLAAGILPEDAENYTLWPAGRYVGSPANLEDEKTVRATLDFLENRADGLDSPFFLGVGLKNPHLNWWAPAEYFDRYDRAEIKAALVRSLQDGTIIPGDGEYYDVPPMSEPLDTHQILAKDLDLWVDYIHAYMACISYADASVGRVLDALDADPALAADTAILLWSDHGYHLGDKDRWNKFTHWREATEVPFVLYDPDAPGGQKADQIVSLVDIFPTVLDLMDVDAPAELGLTGTSLLPIVRDVDIDWYDPGAGKGVAMTTIYGSFSIRVDIPGEGDFRYTRYPDGTEELYDIADDPFEHVNRIDFDTGKGLTANDDRLHAKLSGLMDQALADAGVLMSDGVATLRGGAGDELLVSTNGPGRNVLVGGGGDDTYVLYSASTITEAAGGGFDAVYLVDAGLAAGYVLPANVEMITADAGITGNAARNFINSTTGTVRALGGNDVIHGGEDVNVIYGGTGNDTMTGNQGDDRLYGDAGRDTLEGGAGNDTMTGGGGADTIDASSGGADILDFNAVSDSTPAASDVILGFRGAGPTLDDRIDLSTIDANMQVAGNQAFAFGGTGTGKVWLATLGTDTIVQANIDADAAAELRIVIRDGSVAASAYAASDFIL